MHIKKKKKKLKSYMTFSLKNSILRIGSLAKDRINYIIKSFVDIIDCATNLYLHC